MSSENNSSLLALRNMIIPTYNRRVQKNHSVELVRCDLELASDSPPGGGQGGVHGLQLVRCGHYFAPAAPASRPSLHCSSVPIWLRNVLLHDCSSFLALAELG